MTNCPRSLSRFRGCALGALAGDCLGARFESGHTSFFEESDAEDLAEKVRQHVYANSNLAGSSTRGELSSAEILKYTDDTAMAQDLAESLIVHNGFNAEHLARRFAETCFQRGSRDYGGNVVKVFHQLRDSHYKHPFQPAMKQFDGRGSYGNGGAMRVYPAALFSDEESLVKLVKNQAKITHSNENGVLGALLQAKAVHLALNAEELSIQPAAFTESLKRDCKTEWLSKLNSYQELMDKNATAFTVANVLGNGIAALKSVPAAIFAFLRCLHHQNNVNPLIATIIYAISLGGDTDTIATMAGAIAGAYYGDSKVPECWLQRFEDAAIVSQNSQKIYDLQKINR